MQQCWHSNPDLRPRFSELRTQIDTLITEMAGYVEFSIIPPCVELDQVRISINMFTCEKQLHNKAVVSVFNCKWQRQPIIMVISQDANSVQTQMNTQDKEPCQKAEPSGVCRQDCPLWEGKSPSYLGSANNCEKKKAHQSSKQTSTRN